MAGLGGGGAKAEARAGTRAEVVLEQGRRGLGLEVARASVLK